MTICNSETIILIIVLFIFTRIKYSVEIFQKKFFCFGPPGGDQGVILTARGTVNMFELQYFELLFIIIRTGRIILGSEFSSSIHVFYGIVKKICHIGSLLYV